MILFMVSCFKGINTGFGGHYYSALDMVREFGPGCRLVVVGDFFPNAYLDQPNIIYSPQKKHNITLLSLSDLGIERPVKLVHAYDQAAALFGSKLATTYKIPLVVTKPGGPSLKNTSLIFRNMIFFYRADLESAKNKVLFKPKNVALIPNRVTHFRKAATNRDNPFKGGINTIKLLRIARIGPAYKESIIQSINLLERIESTLGLAELVIVGVLENNDVYSEIQKKCELKNNIRILTSKNFTIRASELIEFSDVVVGTGRGLMEGLGCNKYVFFPVKGQSLPCFATSDSYKEAFEQNFSPRVEFSSVVDPEYCYTAFLKLFSGVNTSYWVEMNENFYDNHSVEGGVKKLNVFYDSGLSLERKFTVAVKIYYRVFLYRLKDLKSYIESYL